ncbi:hypothetical protein GYA19_03060 [Candidatus Beckwithbacteria bacterium]|nr:hypothetical protein [Candidatus Beckwithbacteria bacterium]
MKKILFLFTFIFLTFLLSACSLNNVLKKDEGKTQPTAEDQTIMEKTGKTVEEQNDYLEKQTISDDNSTATLEKELNNIVILDEDFSDTK